MIDISFDFTTDTPDYWNDFWSRNYGLGSGGSDPDALSPMLQKYHCTLWSRELPNGERMSLIPGYGSNYLTWKGNRYGSDSIIVSFRYQRYREILDRVAETLQDYRAYYDESIF